MFNVIQSIDGGILLGVLTDAFLAVFWVAMGGTLPVWLVDSNDDHTSSIVWCVY